MCLGNVLFDQCPVPVMWVSSWRLRHQVAASNCRFSVEGKCLAVVKDAIGVCLACVQYLFWLFRAPSLLCAPVPGALTNAYEQNRKDAELALAKCSSEGSSGLRRREHVDLSGPAIVAFQKTFATHIKASASTPATWRQSVAQLILAGTASKASFR